MKPKIKSGWKDHPISKQRVTITLSEVEKRPEEEELGLVWTRGIVRLRERMTALKEQCRKRWWESYYDRNLFLSFQYQQNLVISYVHSVKIKVVGWECWDPNRRITLLSELTRPLKKHNKKHSKPNKASLRFLLHKCLYCIFVLCFLYKTIFPKLVWEASATRKGRMKKVVDRIS